MLALRPTPHLASESSAQYQLLTDWMNSNYFSRDQCRRLIGKNILLAVKHRGRWWVRINPNCQDLLVDL